jgi:PadR family transcriptional regulator PadR
VEGGGVGLGLGGGSFELSPLIENLRSTGRRGPVQAAESRAVSAGSVKDFVDPARSAGSLDSVVYISCLQRMPRTRRPSKQMLLALRTLADRPRDWRHGYELMKQTGLASGTLYPLLIRMAELGLIEAEWREPAQPGRPARHAYRLTAAGLAVAQREDEARAPSGARLASA